MKRNRPTAVQLSSSQGIFVLYYSERCKNCTQSHMPFYGSLQNLPIFHEIECLEGNGRPRPKRSPFRFQLSPSRNGKLMEGLSILSILCILIGRRSSSSSSNVLSNPLTLSLLIKGASSRIPAVLMPILTSTPDQRKTGAASTMRTRLVTQLGLSDTEVWCDLQSGSVEAFSFASAARRRKLAMLALKNQSDCWFQKEKMNTYVTATPKIP